MPKLLITGLPGSGKSTLARRLLDWTGWQYAGFATLPYQIASQTRGYYLQAVPEPMTGHNNIPISVIVGAGQAVGIRETFRTLGVAAVENALQSHADCILLDEIGRFEADEPLFLEAIRNCLTQQEKSLLAVIKKFDCPHLHEFLNWPGCRRIDLDTVDREAAYHAAKIYLQGRTDV